MPYIGNQPAEQFTSFATQTFSVSATTSYTLDHAVTNENEIALFINNVRQQPGSGKAYTASSTTLTLSEATATTDTMYCIFLGRALQTVTPATNSITAAMVGNDLISGKTALGATPADTDELLISDAGTLKRVDYSYLKSTNTPMVSAYLNSSQSISSNSWTKIQYNTEFYDTDSAYDNSTNYRFTVPSGEGGKYFISAAFYSYGNNNDERQFGIEIHKNGSSFIRHFESVPGYSTSLPSARSVPINAILDLSASDYIEFYGYARADSGSLIFYGDASDRRTFFSIAKMIA